VNGTKGQAGAREAVHRYAAEVRRQLGDLPPDQVEDLTDGLEADLADALADGPPTEEGAAVDVAARFGSPGAYARELRAAAGIPDGADAPAKPWPERVQRLRAGAARAGATVRRQPWVEPVASAATELRPLWWVARAWIGYQVMMWLVIQSDLLLWHIRPERDGMPNRALHWVLLLGLVIISVQWGRGRWGAGQLPRLSRWVTVAALLLVVPVGWFTYESRFYGPEVSDVRYVEVPAAAPVPEDGVWVDGMQVSNLFVYDADGAPLSDVQVYDDRGRAVRTTTDDGWGAYELPGVRGTWAFVPAHDEDGRRRWNVYPLLGAPYEEFDWNAPNATGTVEDLLPTEPRVPPRPFAQAPAVVPRAAGEHGAPAAADPEDAPGAGVAGTQDQGPGPAPSGAPTPGEAPVP
jgi:hypothetical protein